MLFNMESTNVVGKTGASRPAGAARAGWEPRQRDDDELNGAIRAWPSRPPARHFVISANDFAGSRGHSPGSSHRQLTSVIRSAGSRSDFVMPPNFFAISGAFFVRS